MRLNGLDLNLLVALDALLEEQHVTRAGKRVGLTQSATSDALARLRRHYDDDLLARAGNRFELTPLGEALRERVADALGSASHAFGARAAFDPRSSTRDFRVFATGIGLVVVRPLLDRLGALAPGVTVSLLDMDELQRDEAVFGRSDGAIGPRGLRLGGRVTGVSQPRNDIRSEELYRDRWALVSARREPGEPAPTMDDLQGRHWVSAYGDRSTVMSHLATLGYQPTIACSVQDYMAVPMMVTGTDRVAALPARFAQLCATHADLQIDKFPVDIPPLVEAFWWHPNHSHDAGHRWFRTQVAAVVADGCAPTDDVTARISPSTRRTTPCPSTR